jgi:hypothetical protein
MQSEEATLFDPEYRNGRHRHPDWITSIAGAGSVAYRAGSQKARLLAAYKASYPEGLTDDEAAEKAGLPLTSCYWKRCGELRQDNAIAHKGEQRTSQVTGEMRIVCYYAEKEGE